MKNMPGKKSVVSLALALGSAFAVALGVAPVASAAENTTVPIPDQRVHACLS